MCVCVCVYVCGWMSEALHVCVCVSWSYLAGVGSPSGYYPMEVAIVL